MNTFLSDYILKDAEYIHSQIDFNEIKNKSILITGASGLVGHYLVATLNLAAKQGKTPSQVFLVARNGIPEYFDVLVNSLPVKILQGDLTDETFLQNLPHVDYIIHGAGYGQPKKFMFDTLKTLKINTYTTLKLLDNLNTNGKFLFLSSSEIYSGLAGPPFNESQVGCTNTNHSRACYIEGKRCGEAIVNTYRNRNVIAKSVRLSLAYGPGTKIDDDRVMSNFIKKAIREKKINLMDQGSALRTYLYITDAVEMMYQILFFGKSDIYNVGGTSRTTIGDLAIRIGNYLDVPVNFPTDSVGGLAGAPDDVFLDMSKVYQEFKKRDFIDLEEGLKRTIEWQKVLFS